MTQRYTTVAIWLHWIIGAWLVGMVFFGWWMEDLREQLFTDAASPELFAQVQSAYNWHKTAGIMILVLSLVRLGWRLTHPVPPLPDGMKSWEKALARTVHIAFYAVMIGAPIGGYILASSFGDAFPILAFNSAGMELPKLPVPQTEEFREMMGSAHGAGGWTILVLLGVHVAAVIKHELFDNDGTLARMVPFLKM